MAKSSIGETFQLLNTAILKTKERRIDSSYEERLSNLGQSPVMEALHQAILTLSENEKISRDQAAIQIIEAVRELDTIWSDYVMMEGLTQLRELLKGQNQK
jgi:hypothetical protein